ncbi:acetylserotonin O-methyltransferase [Burkholderiaceae bacterium]|nr:acetylserotonin O-methyltransferase [Burkholderiaceae bacterium]
MKDDPTDPAQVQHIVDTALGFWKSKVLLTAIELGVFTQLGQRGIRLRELGGELGLHPRGCADFFDALVALGFLYREGSGEQALYFNTRSAAALLDANSPQYMGGVLEMTNQRVYPFWAHLGEALRSGKPQNEAKATGQSWYEALYADPQRLSQFMAAMAGYQIANFRLLVDKFEFGRFASFCDIGGASGALAIEVAQRCPRIQCITYDLPAVEPIAARRVAEAGLAQRVQVASGNFLTETLPEAEVIAMGNILHNWSVATRKMLIGKVFDALPPGGAFLAIEHLVDDERRSHLAGMLMSLNMLIETAEGSESTAAEFDAWCKEAGFERTEVVPISGGTHVGVAYKG